MAEDEELVLKGSPLYQYLTDNGLSHFEAYEGKQSDPRRFQPGKGHSKCMQVDSPAPLWVVDHLNCILKSGLLLEDHRHFIESYLPLQVQKDPFKMRTFLAYCAPVLCLYGRLRKIARTPATQAILLAAFGVSSLYAVYCTSETLRQRSFTYALIRLQQMLMGLEKNFVQFKRILLLVHQNDFISQNISYRQREMLELKHKLRNLLLSTVQMLFQILDGVKKVPLSIDVDPILHSLTLDEVLEGAAIDEEGSCSVESLKKLFNSYILLQSEFLRRLALCYCPDVLCKLTQSALCKFSHSELPKIGNWSSGLYKTLVQEQKFFRAVMESKDKQSHLKLSSVHSWDFSDIYVSVRSANIHFQSLLIQAQGLQDVLENRDCEHTKDNEEYLSNIAHILTEINKEINSGQICIDAGLVQIFKMINAHHPSAQLTEQETSLVLRAPEEGCVDSAANPPAEDEVFELTVSQEEGSRSDDEESNDGSAEYSLCKKREGETSKKVLQELKTVLVKKAEEWRERERRACESKGIPYVPPEQVKPPVEQDLVKEYLSSSNLDEPFEFLPTGKQNDWPLPRLKGNVQTHRSFRGRKADIDKNIIGEPSQKPVSLEGVKDEAQVEKVRPRMGFGASLLAEAMAKSKAMHTARKEDVFIDSDCEPDGE